MADDVVVRKDDGDGTQLETLSSRKAAARPASKGHLERGWVKHRLIREFALGEKTGRTLAEQYGVSVTSIANFKKRYSMEIEDVRNALADEFAGLWVAEKKSRIAEYQEAAQKMADGRSPRNAEVLVSILKAVAEELGQLPARTNISVSNDVVTYQIVGIDVDADLS